MSELQALGDVGQAVSSTLDLQEVLATIVANATRLAGADGGIVYEYDEGEGVFEVRAADQMTEDLAELLRSARFHIGEGAVGRAAAARTPIQVEEAETSTCSLHRSAIGSSPRASTRCSPSRCCARTASSAGW